MLTLPRLIKTKKSPTCNKSILKKYHFAEEMNTQIPVRSTSVISKCSVLLEACDVVSPYAKAQTCKESRKHSPALSRELIKSRSAFATRKAYTHLLKVLQNVINDKLLSFIGMDPGERIQINHSIFKSD